MFPTSMIELSLVLPAFALVATRVSGIVITAPLLGSAVIPARIKAALVMAISATIFPALAPTLPADVTFVGVATGLVGELSIGLVIGIGLSIVLLATQMTGMIVGQQVAKSRSGAINTNATSRIGRDHVLHQLYGFRFPLFHRRGHG